jgi:hypothetical protein
VEADLVRVVEAGSAPKNVYSLLRRAWEHAERTGEFHMVDRRLDDSRAARRWGHSSRTTGMARLRRVTVPKLCERNQRSCLSPSREKQARPA